MGIVFINQDDGASDLEEISFLGEFCGFWNSAFDVGILSII